MANTTDVLVLGSGAAGLAAALTAGVGGAEVTVLEASDLFGGTTAVSGGGMWLPGNTLDPDFADSMDDARVYLKRLTLGFVSDAIINRYLAECGKIPDFFSEHSPLSFTADIGRPDYFAPFEGSSLTSRTVFPATYELPRLGELEPKVRRPAPGGILPIQHTEERRMGARPDPQDGSVAKRRATRRRQPADQREAREGNRAARHGARRRLDGGLRQVRCHVRLGYPRPQPDRRGRASRRPSCRARP